MSIHIFRKTINKFSSSACMFYIRRISNTAATKNDIFYGNYLTLGLILIACPISLDQVLEPSITSTYMCCIRIFGLINNTTNLETIRTYKEIVKSTGYIFKIKNYLSLIILQAYYSRTSFMF